MVEELGSVGMRYKLPVIANQSAFLVWQSPKDSGRFSFRFPIQPGDSHASVRYFSE